MEEEEATVMMEVEDEHPTLHKHHPNSKDTTFNHFGLKNTIQTNFGDDYVFQLVPKFDWSLMGVSLSTNAVKLYSPMTGQYFGECKGHSSTINHISFAGPSSPHVLHSCSSDGTIRAWDTRTFKEEVFSFSFGGSANNLLSSGCKSQILFWDWRSKKQVASLEESHMEDVTQVRFVPHNPNKLVSASVDGLICVFDTAGDINDDEHMDTVMNVGSSIGKVGIFGDAYQKLWCLTHIETLSVWDWKEGTNKANFQDARSLASDSWTLDHVDYFVDCQSGEGENLWVIGGTNAGTLGYFPVRFKGTTGIGPPEAVIEGGHADVVRSVLPMSTTAGTPAQRRGIFGWTGGEDGRLCCWSSDNSSDIRSWMSSNLVLRSPKCHQKKNRYNPY